MLVGRRVPKKRTILYLAETRRCATVSTCSSSMARCAFSLRSTSARTSAGRPPCHRAVRAPNPSVSGASTNRTTRNVLVFMLTASSPHAHTLLLALTTSSSSSSSSSPSPSIPVGFALNRRLIPRSFAPHSPSFASHSALIRASFAALHCASTGVASPCAAGARHRGSFSLLRRASAHSPPHRPCALVRSGPSAPTPPGRRPLSIIVLSLS